MPKDTFFRLPEEKRKRILDAAEQEFHRVPYGEASINKIIKTAGIPRGSFYQYFSDKEDIFLYYLSTIIEEIKSGFYRNMRNSSGDYFGFINLYIDRFEEFYRSGDFGKAMFTFVDDESLSLMRSRMGKIFMNQMEESITDLFLKNMDFDNIDVETEEEKRFFLGIAHAVLGETVHKIFGQRDVEDADALFQELRGRMRSLEKHYIKTL